MTWLHDASNAFARVGTQASACTHACVALQRVCVRLWACACVRACMVGYVLRVESRSRWREASALGAQQPHARTRWQGWQGARPRALASRQRLPASTSNTQRDISIGIDCATACGCREEVPTRPPAPLQVLFQEEANLYIVERKADDVAKDRDGFSAPLVRVRVCACTSCSACEGVEVLHVGWPGPTPARGHLARLKTKKARRPRSNANTAANRPHGCSFRSLRCREIKPGQNVE